MNHVFISYVRENASEVQRLTDLFTAQGVSVWLDKNQIAPGVRWPQAIRRAIQDGAYFIACFSNEYNARSRTYMNEELTLAIEILRQQPTDQSWFIPVKLNECEIPDRDIGGGDTLQNIQWVDLYRDWDSGIQRLLKVINQNNQVAHTGIVKFETERKPNLIDLQRAIHTISTTNNSDTTFRVPLEYDLRLSTLLKNLDLLYNNYAQLMEKHGGAASVRDFSSVQTARVGIPNILNAFRDILGLVIMRLFRAQLGMTDVDITTTMSRFIELVLTDIISTLASFQFDSDPAKILTEYSGLGSLAEYVAKIDEIPVENLVSYRIVFAGDSTERIIFAPMSFGSRLLIYREFHEKGRGYIPPISFMTKYAFPQMFWWHWNEPNNWNIEWRCESVHVKDLGGHYLSENGTPF